ncbi:T9SS type A sorting domain-containing protein [Winogradskyella sp. HB-48]|uniref:T9SS type A sorting domain-containing protein n=1 Tax=Winogradskyella sp. HB-48 TaxID=3416808 RepID=UPI003CF0F120
MKKITINVFVMIFMLGTFAGVSQTLNQPANWPNAAWTLSGSYTPAGLLADPTNADATFTFDDDGAGNGSADTIEATSPVIDLTAASGAGETWITISGAFTYYPLGGDVLAIEVYDADAMTWSQLYQFVGNTTTVANYQNCTISEAYTTPVLDISGFTATQLSGFQYRVSYDDLGGWQYGWCIESPTITSAAPPTCIEPTMLTLGAVTDVEAIVSWTNDPGATLGVEYEFGASGFAPGTGASIAAGGGIGTSATSGTTLMPETAYDFYVRSNCDTNGFSNWAGPVSFTTTCAAIAAPYNEDFETFTVSPAAFSSENCWTGSNTGGSYFWESAAGTDTSSGGTGPSPTITTGNYFFTESSGSSAGDIAELVSPLIDLTTLTTPALLFNYHMFGGQIGTLEILVNNTDSVWSLSGEQQASDIAPWELAVVDLTTYSGQSITVTIRATGAGSFEGDIAIDNVSFGELPSCPAPNALTATNITDTTADLGWTENGSATAWDVELGLDGFAPTGTPTAAGVPNPYTAMGLTENTAYDFYVRADCGSAWVGPFSFTTLETCPTPSALTATNITETSADLGWTENGAATSWNIELVDITAGGTVTGTPTATGVTNPYMAMGLSGDNSYQYYVQADCGVDGVSAWAGPFSFNTPYVAVPPDCTNGIFLDSGGQSGNYSNSENITYTICPDSPGDVVTVEFISFNTENNGASACYDGLTVYDGADTAAPTINPPGGGTIWCWDRNDATPAGTGDLQGMMITSTDPSGCVTFVFTSDSSVVRSGWVANVLCNPLSIDNLEDAAAFTYYPNPVQNTLTLNAQNTIENVAMYNMLGQEVLIATPNAVNSELDMSNLQDGTYFVKVTIANTTKTIRVVKN